MMDGYWRVVDVMRHKLKRRKTNKRTKRGKNLKTKMRLKRDNESETDNKKMSIVGGTFICDEDQLSLGAVVACKRMMVLDSMVAVNKSTKFSMKFDSLLCDASCANIIWKGRSSASFLGKVGLVDTPKQSCDFTRTKSNQSQTVGIQETTALPTLLTESSDVPGPNLTPSAVNKSEVTRSDFNRSEVNQLETTEVNQFDTTEVNHFETTEVKIFDSNPPSIIKEDEHSTETFDRRSPNVFMIVGVAGGLITIIIVAFFMFIIIRRLKGKPKENIADSRFRQGNMYATPPTAGHSTNSDPDEISIFVTDTGDIGLDNDGYWGDEFDEVDVYLYANYQASRLFSDNSDKSCGPEPESRGIYGNANTFGQSASSTSDIELITFHEGTSEEAVAVLEPANTCGNIETSEPTTCTESKNILDCEYVAVDDIVDVYEGIKRGTEEDISIFKHRGSEIRPKSANIQDASNTSMKPNGAKDSSEKRRSAYPRLCPGPDQLLAIPASSDETFPGQSSNNNVRQSCNTNIDQSYDASIDHSQYTCVDEPYNRASPDRESFLDIKKQVSLNMGGSHYYSEAVFITAESIEHNRQSGTRLSCRAGQEIDYERLNIGRDRSPAEIEGSLDQTYNVASGFFGEFLEKKRKRSLSPRESNGDLSTNIEETSKNVSEAVHIPYAISQYSTPNETDNTCEYPTYLTPVPFPSERTRTGENIEPDNAVYSEIENVVDVQDEKVHNANGFCDQLDDLSDVYFELEPE